MAFGNALSGFEGGLNSGVSLYNALQMQPILRQQAQAQAQMEAQKLADYQNRIPTSINGQTFQLPTMAAAQFQENLAEKQLQAKMMQQLMIGRMGMQQSFQGAKLSPSEQIRLDAANSALPIHNAAMALGQAYVASNSGDQSKMALALTQAKEFMAQNHTLAPYVSSIGNDPSNIPKLYDAIITQGAIEQNKLSTGSTRPMDPSHILEIKNSLYPSLAQWQSSPDVAYGMFKHFSDAYIQPAFEAAQNHLLQASNGDTENPQFENPTIANTYQRIVQQQAKMNETLYQMPGMGPKGTPPPEIQSTIPGLETNGAPSTLRAMVPQGLDAPVGVPGLGSNSSGIGGMVPNAATPLLGAAYTPQGVAAPSGLAALGIGSQIPAAPPQAPITPSAALPTIQQGSKPMPMRTASGVSFNAL